ncbi:MAG TPA: hypothetical protein VER76_16195, partial [Pyrinomonadaceae bacterium]|nr:hypothetical protein [Pyrinomonadaceae bacterium]
MNRVRFTLNLLITITFVLVFAAMAQAQATRTWVSGVGDDVNPCSRTAPCKTFAGAISKTAASGEINTLDPGGFGTLTITKSITVDGESSGKGGILSSGGISGMIVNDANSGAPNTAQVILRHLSIDGAGTGADGIRFISGRRLTVEHCVVFGFTGDGLETAPSTGTNFNITVNNSSFIRNGTGIRQGTTIGTLNISYDNVVIAENAGDGLVATGGTGNLSRSFVDSNGGSGVNVSGGAILHASDNQVTANATNGFNNTSPSTIRLTNNNVYRNATGINGNGTYQSFGNNKVIGNT